MPTNIHIKSLLCLLLLLSLLSLPAWGQTAQEQTANHQLQTSIDHLLRQAMDNRQIASAVILVARDGQTVFQGAYGYQNPASQQAMAINSIFRLSSLSKAFTTMAAAALIEKGVISFDDPVSKWLPYFTPSLADGRQPLITVGQLMSHRAGLDYGFFQGNNGAYAKAMVSSGLDDIAVSLEENMQRLANAPLIYEPGTSWQYSMATDVLGAVVASAYGGSLPMAMRELVLAPLGLDDTGFTVADATRLVVPCYLSQQGLRPMEETQPVVLDNMGHYIMFSQLRAYAENAWPSGGAGMLASGPDVLALLEAIRQNRLASAAVMERINTNQIQNTPMLGPGVGFGLGWAIVVEPKVIDSPQSPGSIGWSGVYGHNWFVDQSKGISVVVMTSTAMEVDLFLKVRDAVYRDLY